MTAQCLISFGSNLGERSALIAEAAHAIAQSPLVQQLRTSRLFETPPIGGPGGQDPFLNAVAAFETDGSARDILAMLQATENRLGRQRRHRWGARSIDLDVVLHGELIGGGTGLVVPHPRYTARQFVLQPACDVAAHYRDPRFGWTLRELADHVAAAVPSLALIGDELETRAEICRRLQSEHGIHTIAARPLPAPMEVVGNAPSAIRAVATETTSATTALDVSDQTAWVAAFVPPLPPLQSPQTSRPEVPRLIARIQRATPQTAWPAPHQMWPGGWQWPEYRLEVDDMDWAVREVASALDSMRCPLRPVSDTGDWW